MKSRFPIVGIAATILIVGLTLIHSINNTINTKTTPETEGVISPLLSSESHVLGNRDASIRMFVYTDLDCASCKEFHQITLPQLIKKYGKDLLVIYKEFPLKSHPQSFKEAEAAECAYQQGGNSVFFKYIENLFPNLLQNDTYSSTVLKDTAESIGLSVTLFQNCLDSGQQKVNVSKDLTEGALLGVNKTPSEFIIINGSSILVSGNHLDLIEAAIQKLGIQQK